MENIYDLQNFTVFPNDLKGKVCVHHYKIVFNGGTTGKEVDIPQFPPIKFGFQDFGEILARKCRPDILLGNVRPISLISV